MSHERTGFDETAAFELQLIHRDRHLAVLDKPAHVSMFADRSGAPSLWDMLPAALGARPYPVHRLDKGTSGVLLVALDQPTQSRLTRAFQQRRVRKYYLAWVVGTLEKAGTLSIDLPLRKGRKNRYRIAGPRESIRRGERGWDLDAPTQDGHDALTRIRSLHHGGRRTLLLASPATGRTHQLRVHLSWIGHPILGDHLYGRPRAPEQRSPRLQLHCHRLVVPAVGSFSAAPPDNWLPRRLDPESY